MYTRIIVLAALLIALASNATAQCTAGNLKSVSDFEKDSLVIDVRPDEINQFRGRSSFKNEARIVLVNMNPFLFSKHAQSRSNRDRGHRVPEFP